MMQEQQKQWIRNLIETHEKWGSCSAHFCKAARADLQVQSQQSANTAHMIGRWSDEEGTHLRSAIQAADDGMKDAQKMIF